MTAGVRVVGVRHHSPACARLVQHVIARDKPDFVLVEGPSDFNPRIDELLLDHKPPVAIYSYVQQDQGTRSSWSPFCEYSPEWVALREGHKVGATVMFMDLPVWTRPFREVENRYADRRPNLGYDEELCRRLGVEGTDSLWDHLFESAQDLDELEKHLACYFEAFRESEPPTQSDLEREVFMASFLAWAAQQGGSVVAVCGGFHKPRLEACWKDLPATRPDIPTPQDCARRGSYLVPYSYHRLDSFTGYASGMPSPHYYDCLWRHGPERAWEMLTEDVLRRLRKKKQPISSADLINARSVTEGLMRLRGHHQPLRTDVLDGLAGALVKEALEVPLPWSRRRSLHPATHPIIVEMVAAFSGDKCGVLDQATPLPPLVFDVREQLESEGLTPETIARLQSCPGQSGASHLLHRIRLLGIPGFALVSVSQDDEEWRLFRDPMYDSALIEAGAWGATVEEAVRTRLEERLFDCEGRLDKVASILSDSHRAGLKELSDGLLQTVEEQIQIESRFERLGAAAAVLLELYRSVPTARMGRILESLVGRGLWLFESLCGASDPSHYQIVSGVAALRDIYKHGQALDLNLADAHDVMDRRGEDSDAPPMARGAALGFLWSTRGAELERTLTVLLRSSLPQEMGDFLAGLFGVAREEVVSEEGLIDAINRVVCGYPENDFLVAVPALRMAFTYFPPRERGRVARQIATLLGLTEEEAQGLLRLKTTPAALAACREIDVRTGELMERFGLKGTRS